MIVVIALHPSVFYNREEDKFRVEKRITGKTIELIKNVEFVILYASTSVDLAVLYDRPVLYYTSHDLENTNRNSIKGNLERNCKEYLNAKYLFIDCMDECEHIQDCICYDKTLYKKYKNTFIFPSEGEKEKQLAAVFKWIRNNREN